MSILPLLVDLQTSVPTLIPLEGVLDWITLKNTQTQTVVRAVAVTIAIIFVVVQAITSRFAMARIIVTGLAAGLFVWIVWNVTTISNTVGEEMTGYISLVPAQITPAQPGEVGPSITTPTPSPVPTSPPWA